MLCRSEGQDPSSDHYDYERAEKEAKQAEWTIPVLLLRGNLAKVIRKLLGDLGVNEEDLLLDQEHQDDILETVLPEADWSMLTCAMGWDYAFVPMLLRWKEQLSAKDRQAMRTALLQCPKDADLPTTPRKVPHAVELDVIRFAVWNVLDSTPGDEDRRLRLYTAYMTELIERE